MHKDALVMARIDFPQKKADQKAKGKKKDGGQGSAEKKNSSDTWCDHHKFFYPLSLKHDSKTCRAKKLG